MKPKRILFSENFIRKEVSRLNEFRDVFRLIINLMNQRKEFIKFIVSDSPESAS